MLPRNELQLLHPIGGVAATVGGPWPSGAAAAVAGTAAASAASAVNAAPRYLFLRALVMPDRPLSTPGGATAAPVETVAFVRPPLTSRQRFIG
jgi:hypothetical protein